MTLQVNGYVSPYPVDPMPDWVVALRDSAEPVWLFAYGSLMWNPEMPFAERRPALLRGYHRSFCLYSRDYRGTPERPGLVLGLDRGGSCQGIAYRLPPDGLGAAIDQVWAREMAGEVYRMRPVSVTMPQGRIAGYAFVVRRDRPDYAGRLSLDEAARIISVAALREASVTLAPESMRATSAMRSLRSTRTTPLRVMPPSMCLETT